MICPFDETQMHQLVENGQPQGGGSSTDKKYETWEIKICQTCGRKAKESYACEVI
jgi:hypothetical protein